MTVAPVRPGGEAPSYDHPPTEAGAAAGRDDPGTRWGVPGVVLTLMALFAIPSDSVIRVIGAMGFPGGLAAMTLFGAWVVLTVTRIHHPAAHRNPTTSLLVVFTVSTLVAYVVTQLGHPDGETIRGADRGLMLNAACAGLILVVAQGCNSRRAIRRVIDALLVGTAVCALVALVDGITGIGVADQLKDAVPGFTRNSEYGAVGSREGLNRVAGTALHPIEFGAVVAMVLSLGVARVFTTRAGHRAVRLCLTAVVALGIPLSLSRSALLGAAIVLLTLLTYTTGPRRMGLLLTAGIAAVLTWLALPRVVSAFVSIVAGWSQDDSIAARVFDYEPFLRTFGAHPWFGQGLSTVRSETIWDILDNQYLGWLLERGLVGTLGPLALMVGPLALAIRLYRRLPEGEDKTYAASLAAAFAVGVLLSGTFDSFGFPMFVLVHCVLVGLLGAVWVHADLAVDRAARSRVDRARPSIRSEGLPWSC